MAAGIVKQAASDKTAAIRTGNNPVACQDIVHCLVERFPLGGELPLPFRHCAVTATAAALCPQAQESVKPGQGSDEVGNLGRRHRVVGRHPVT